MFDRFDAFLAQSNVSFQALISQKMALIEFFNRCGSKDELELNGAPKTIEVCNNDCWNLILYQFYLILFHHFITIVHF